MVSNYVLDEALTLSRLKTKDCIIGEIILDFVRQTKGGRRIFMEIILDFDMVLRTEILYKKYCPTGLSFTDCSLLALMKSFEIEFLASFDTGFSGLASIVN